MKFLIPSGRLHKQYLNYIYWSSFSNLIIGVETVLSTHSMLSSLGASQTVDNLSLNYILKDIIGQSVGLLFVKKISKYSDTDSKNFLRNSLYAQQVAVLLECSTPLLYDELFIPIASTSNVIKGVSFIGIGSINAKIVNVLSIDKDNIGELYTKIATVNTITTSIGMTLGLFTSVIIPCHTTRLFFLPFLAWIRNYSFMRAIKGIF